MLEEEIKRDEERIMLDREKERRKARYLEEQKVKLEQYLKHK